MVAFTPQGLQGYVPNPVATEAIIRDRSSRVFAFNRTHRAELDVAGLNARLGDKNREPIILLDATLALDPSWTRGAQGTDDCVSWGWALGCRIWRDVDVIERGAMWEASLDVATEPIYGGARVEVDNQGRPLRSGKGGTYGAAAAKWVTSKGGLLLRADYSLVTGNQEHDLRKYSTNRANAFGQYGCGGRNDRGALDAQAQAAGPAKAYRLSSGDEAAAAIENGYPVPVCSGFGFPDTRDRDGMVTRRGSWAHCMCFTGLRYDRPALLLTNSWGYSWRGPSYPTGYRWPAVMQCSAWVPLQTG